MEKMGRTGTERRGSESPSVRASHWIFAKGVCKAKRLVLVPTQPLKHLLL